MERFGVDFGFKLGGKLGPSWHQNLKNEGTKTMSKNMWEKCHAGVCKCMRVYAEMRGGAPYNQSIKPPKTTQWALEHSSRAQGPVADICRDLLHLLGARYIISVLHLEPWISLNPSPVQLQSQSCTHFRPSTRRQRQLQSQSCTHFRPSTRRQRRKQLQDPQVDLLLRPKQLHLP